MNRTSLVIASAAVLLACSPSPAPEPLAVPEPVAAAAGELDRDALASGIKRHFESSGQITPDVDAEVVDVTSSGLGDLGELRKITVRLSQDDQEQTIDFLVSADGRWFFRSEPVDLSVDPVAQVVDSIKIGPDDPYRGTEDADVTIVEYSDFQCPFCARAETIVQDEVLKEYGDRIRFVYKQMPLVSIHPWAQTASEIGICLLRHSGNEAYWKYHGLVFARQRDVQADTAEDQLSAIAGEAGGDIAKVKACVAAEEATPVIVATLEEAEALGVNSTPTFFINGRRLSGAQPLDAFKAIIDPELAGAG